MIEIDICSREEAGAILSSPSRRKNVCFLVSIGEAEDRPPAGYQHVARRLRLLFADVDVEEGGPTRDDVRRIVEAARALASADGRVVIHCQAGISRSTAAAVIFHAVQLGDGGEEEAVARVLAARQWADPNRRMVALADELLGREGRLLAALDRAMDA